MMISTISATVLRGKKWSCATSSTFPIRPSSFNNRRTSPSRAPSKPAISRTRGGRNRSCPPSSGAIFAQSLSSVSVSRTECFDNRTQAPSRAMSPDFAILCRKDRKAGRRQASLQLHAQWLEPDAGKIRMFVVKLVQSPQQDTLQSEPLRCRHRQDGVRSMQLERIAKLQQTRGIFGRERAIARKCREIDKKRRLIKKRRECLSRLGQRVCCQLGKPFRCASLACRRAQVEEFATANRALCCRIAQDKPISGRCGRRLIKHQLNQAFPTRRDRTVAEENDACSGFGSAVMQAHRHPLADWPCFS